MADATPEKSLALRQEIGKFVTDTLSSGGRLTQPARAQVVEEMVASALHLEADGADMGQLRLVRTALREMRAAYKMFNRWRGTSKVSVFGSARTPLDHPDYQAARTFGREMARAGWMVTTGAAGGIMQAALEDAGREASFGLGIRLPMEGQPNEIIRGDPKLVEFRYFFTRKLMFLSHADAVAVFPGGFGTMDEIFEVLTLAQTGRASPTPIVLVEGAGQDGKRRGWWQKWMEHQECCLLEDRFISPEDFSLFEYASSPSDAVERIGAFYRRYHSSRFVGDQLVIRMKSELSPEELAGIRRDFAPLCASGGFEQRAALQQEGELEHLPRLVFTSTRRSAGLLRRLIDRINGRSMQSLLVCVLALGLALCGCDSSPTALPATASSGDASTTGTVSARSAQRASPALRQSEGIELVVWSVPDRQAGIGKVLASLGGGLPEDSPPAVAMSRNGIELRRFQIAQLDDLISSLGGSYTDVRVWHGQAPDWREATQRVALHGESVMIDGRPASLADSFVRLSFRGWTLPTEDGGAVDVDLATSIVEGVASVRVEALRPSALRGSEVISCRVSLTLPRGEGLLVAGAQTAPLELSGPPGEMPPSLGEWLFSHGDAKEANERRRTVLLFLPAIPDAVFPIGN